MNNNMCMFICENFKHELAAVIAADEFDDVGMSVFPARCGRPPLDWDELSEHIGSCGDGVRCAILGSSCCAKLADPPGEFSHCRVHKLNQCFYLFADPVVIDGYISDGVYLITPGWLKHWQHHIDEWGFDQNTAREFFAESATRLVLLDTGIDADAREKLREFAAFTDRPCELVPVGLGYFRLLLTKIMLEWQMENHAGETSALLEHSQKQVSDYAMAMELLNNFGQTMTESEVVEQIFGIFSMLFAPQHLVYLPIESDKPGTILHQGDLSESEKAAIRNRLADFTGVYELTESGKGFRLRIDHEHTIAAIVEVDQIAFPEYTERYLNLALSIVGVCGLAIHNGRIYRKHKQAQAMLQQYARELEQANDEVKQFAYIISHDLRAPLVNIKGFSAELRYGLDDIQAVMQSALPHLNEAQQESVQTALEEDIPEAFHFIESSVNRMDGFINALLELSRLGRHELKPEQVELRPIVEAVLKDIAHQLEERSTKVTMGTLPSLIADHTALEQIVGNLLHNAVKYWEPTRPLEIDITSETAEHETIIHIRDNGRGIAENDLEKVFAPFRRVGKENVPGVGMGLAYVQTMVRRHGGRITCASELGAGTTFTLSISNNKSEKE